MRLANYYMIDLHYLNFQSSIQGEWILVDYWAEWCQSCLVFMPILESLENEMGKILSFAKVNVGDNQIIAREQKVRNIPSLILYYNGKEIHRFAENYSKEIIKKNIYQIIENHDINRN